MCAYCTFFLYMWHAQHCLWIDCVLKNQKVAFGLTTDGGRFCGQQWVNLFWICRLVWCWIAFSWFWCGLPMTWPSIGAARAWPRSFAVCWLVTVSGQFWVRCRFTVEFHTSGPHWDFCLPWLHCRMSRLVKSSLTLRLYNRRCFASSTGNLWAIYRLTMPCCQLITSLILVWWNCCWYFSQLAGKASSM